MEGNKTAMDWIKRLTRAMDYIEANLARDIDWAEVGRLALCPGSQFARTFGLMAGIPLSEYVRLRRLTLAAQDLQLRGDKVIDVAMRYGYASPTAFQRAFTIFHDITPSQARRAGAKLSAYPPISFHITIQGGIALQYRIEEKPALRMVGIREEVSMTNGTNFDRIPKMWDEMSPERYDALNAMMEKPMSPLYGVVEMTSPEMLAYTIAAQSDEGNLKPWMTEIDVPAATYAIFETSLKDIQDVTRRIYAEWLPNSGYEHTVGPDLEVYPHMEDRDPSCYMCEVWIPVAKK